MVDLKRMKFTLTQEYDIVGFRVYWHVDGKGVFPDLGAALDAAKGERIQSVSVAVSNNPDIFEVIP